MRLDEMFTILTEMDFRDRWPLLDELAKHRGKKRFIHFTKPLPMKPSMKAQEREVTDRYGNTKTTKLTPQRSPEAVKFGINPQPGPGSVHHSWSNPMRIKTHSDPAGIYFYPVDWLYSDLERIRNGDQYALDWPYWYIVDVDWSSHGLTLSKTTWDDITKLATANGWIDEWQAYRDNPEPFKSSLPYFIKWDVPGSVLWYFVQYLVKERKISWLKAFKGLTYIHDDGVEAIERHEPDQLMILDTRIIKTIDQGEQKQPVTKNTETGTYAYWEGLIKRVMTRLRGNLGGEIKWLHRQPTYSLDRNGAHFDLTFVGSTWTTGLRLAYSYGRARDDIVLAFKDHENLDALVAAITAQIGRISAHAKKGRDLLFTPLLSIEATKKALQDGIAASHPLTFDITISNEGDRPDFNLTGRYAFTGGDVAFETEIYAVIGSKQIFLSVDIKGNGNSLGRATVSNDNANDLETLYGRLRDKLGVMSDYALQSHAPGERNSFHDENEMNSFKGWLALNCNLNPDTVLTPYLSSHIDDYTNDREKDDMIRNLKWVFRPTRW